MPERKLCWCPLECHEQLPSQIEVQHVSIEHLIHYLFFKQTQPSLKGTLSHRDWMS